MNRPAAANPLAQINDSARINHLFSTPVATFSHPNHEAFKADLLALLQRRLGDVENKFDYKAETAADLSQWGEVITDRLTTWVLASATQFVEASLGQDLQSAYRTAASQQLGTQNSSGRSSPDALRTGVEIAVKRSWASFYQKGTDTSRTFTRTQPCLPSTTLPLPLTANLTYQTQESAPTTLTQGSPSPTRAIRPDCDATQAIWSSFPAGSSTPYQRCRTTASASPCHGTYFTILLPFDDPRYVMLRTVVILNQEFPELFPVNHDR